ncbi:IS3 family transposase [Cohnella sp.]|uniref:IS3 family transposase n=1 Tax=Cohnella sp. TaxID=1883426 RepID=UPI00356A1F1C
MSLSRVGRCIDKGPMESFWGTLKCENYYLHTYRSFEELKEDNDDYIHFYNYERLQSKNGLSPMEFSSTDFYFLYCLLDGVQFKLWAASF